MKINGRRETQSQIFPHQESWSTKQPREFGWEGCQDRCQSNGGKNPSPLARTTSLSPPEERDVFPRIDSNLFQSKVRDTSVQLASVSTQGNKDTNAV